MGYISGRVFSGESPPTALLHYALLPLILTKRPPLPEGNECGHWMLKSKLWLVAEIDRLILLVSLISRSHNQVHNPISTINSSV